jgi:hypothetical protein
MNRKAADADEKESGGRMKGSDPGIAPGQKTFARS